MGDAWFKNYLQFHLEHDDQARDKCPQCADAPAYYKCPECGRNAIWHDDDDPTLVLDRQDVRDAIQAEIDAARTQHDSEEDGNDV
jgi:predicted RNA-binding Zn-ribbon protein involved in translation (DUF1610 family)